MNEKYMSEKYDKDCSKDVVKGILYVIGGLLLLLHTLGFVQRFLTVFFIFTACAIIVNGLVMLHAFDFLIISVKNWFKRS
jgi:UPF0716 family protein affecting phage T7 exclusion